MPTSSATCRPGRARTSYVAGSASLFGVDGGAIGRTTGETTLNLGLHAGLDIDLLLAQADRFVDANDRVLIRSNSNSIPAPSRPS